MKKSSSRMGLGPKSRSPQGGSPDEHDRVGEFVVTEQAFEQGVITQEQIGVGLALTLERERLPLGDLLTSDESLPPVARRQPLSDRKPRAFQPLIGIDRDFLHRGRDFRRLPVGEFSIPSLVVAWLIAAGWLGKWSY